MSELILKEDALNCFYDWIDRYGYEHTADEDPVYQRIAELKSIEDCDDAISRQMAIEAIDKWFIKAHPLNMSAYEYNSAYVQGEIDAYITAIDTLKTLAPVQPEAKWISCKEKMPEEDLWTGASQQYSYGVLMYVLDDDGEKMIDFGHTIDGKWYSDTAGAYVENSSNWKVIAWMLPPSYKENE